MDRALNGFRAATELLFVHDQLDGCANHSHPQPHELAAPNHCAAVSGRSFLPAQSLNKAFYDNEKLFVAAIVGPFIVVDGALAQTWIQTDAPNQGWFSVAGSADGAIWAAAGYPGIYISTNSGTNWI